MNVETVEIKKIGINGEGIGYINRKIVFVPGALIGETVKIEIVKQSRNFYEGKIIKIEEVSKDRKDVKCPLNDECQGCSLLHMKYNSQLRYKKEAIRESIRKYTSYDLSKTIFKDVIASKQVEGFITNVNLPIVSDKGRISFGIYQRESKALTIMTNCFKQHPKINQCLKQLERILTKHKCKLYSDKTKLGLRFLKVKLVSDSLQVVIIAGRDGVAPEILEEISKLAMVDGVFMSSNTSRYQEFEEIGYTKAYGNTRIAWNDDAKNKFLIGVKSELPDNIEAFKVKNQEIHKMLSDSHKIISLHCGIGVLELTCDKEFVAIDEKKDHIEDAKLNQKWFKKENIQFVKGDVDERVATYAKKKIYDTMLIQNARFGLSEEIKDSIRLAKMKHVIYKCDSHSTLAKDLADLERYYTLDKIVAIDSFVHTPYVTTIVKLTRK